MSLVKCRCRRTSAADRNEDRWRWELKLESINSPEWSSREINCISLKLTAVEISRRPSSTGNNF